MRIVTTEALHDAADILIEYFTEELETAEGDLNNMPVGSSVAGELSSVRRIMKFKTTLDALHLAVGLLPDHSNI